MSDTTTPPDDGTTPAGQSGSTTNETIQRIVNPRNENLGFQQAMITLASSIGAVVLSFLIAGLLLLVTGKDPLAAYGKMLEVGLTPDKLLETLQRATPFIIAAVAVAIGFKMNLFNIGVEGQFLIGMFAAAVIGAQVNLPAPLHVTFCILVGALFGSLWASIAAVLKVKRGVNEVISTIMLNAIALSIIDWLFNEFFRFDPGTGALDVKTEPLPETAWMPDLVDGKLNAFFLFALLVAFCYWILVFKSRFGFRLRSSGLNAAAAQTAGISAKRMILTALLISGAVAGMAGLPSLLGDIHAYGTTRPDGYGFTGIAVALLGRNHPAGIVAAACLYGFLDAVAGPLQLEDIPQSIVRVIQAITLLTVVIVNEAVGRWYAKRTAERAAQALQVAGVAA